MIENGEIDPPSRPRLLLADFQRAVAEFVASRPESIVSHVVNDDRHEQAVAMDRIQSVNKAMAKKEATSTAEEINESPEALQKQDSEWFGLNRQEEILPLNTVLEELGLTTESAIEEMLHDETIVAQIIHQLVDNGMNADNANDLLEKYQSAWRQCHQQRFQEEQNRKQRMIEDQTQVVPIVQCQACLRTAEYWAPCWVAPIQIGERVVSSASANLKQ